MLLRVLTGLAWVAALFAGALSQTFASGTAAPRVALIAVDGAEVRAEPAASGRGIAELVQQTQVDVLKYRAGWAHIRFWASAKGWVPKADLTFRHLSDVPSTYVAPTVHSPIRAHGPSSIRVSGQVLSTLVERSRIDGPAIGSVRTGNHVRMVAWAQTSSGSVWYETSTKAWIWAGAVRLLTGDPAASRPGAARLWSRITGKGMWVTLGSIEHGATTTLTRAARADGVTHLYVESAISPLGFHGESMVGPLIDAAHRQHLRVVAWVYPYLGDVGSDVDLTSRVAAFRSASGQHFDGLALDIERNMDAAHVRTYLGLARASVGSNELIVGVTYPPQSLPTFPFDEVAHFCNLIAPMDYWHQTKTPFGLNYDHMRYGYAYTYRYTVDSISAIRRATGGRTPVVPIGQTFDDFGRLAMGPYAPSRAEIEGFLAGAAASRSPEISFFQWSSATEGEWQAISAYRFQTVQRQSRKAS